MCLRKRDEVLSLALRIIPESWRARYRTIQDRVAAMEWIARADVTDTDVAEIVDYLRRGTWTNLCFPYPFSENIRLNQFRFFVTEIMGRLMSGHVHMLISVPSSIRWCM